MWMVDGRVFGCGKNLTRGSNVPRRNPILNAMQMNFLSAWGQGNERKFLGFSSMLVRYEQRMERKRQRSGMNTDG